MLMWASVNREKRHAKRSSQDVDGLGRASRAGVINVRVGGNVLIIVEQYCEPIHRYIKPISNIGFDCLSRKTISVLNLSYCPIWANPISVPTPPRVSRGGGRGGRTALLGRVGRGIRPNLHDIVPILFSPFHLFLSR